MPESPVRMLCIYRIREGKDAEFESLLEKHWPTLRDAGLASPKPARWFRGASKDGKSRFVELFEWKDGEASDRRPSVASGDVDLGAHGRARRADGVHRARKSD